MDGLVLPQIILYANAFNKLPHTIKFPFSNVAQLKTDSSVSQYHSDVCVQRLSVKLCLMIRFRFLLRLNECFVIDIPFSSFIFSLFNFPIGPFLCFATQDITMSLMD